MKFNFNQTIKVGDREISQASKVFIIAEAGVNHNASMKLAKRLIDIACESKVDAIKFQAFKTENLILKGVRKAPYQRRTTRIKESQFNMLKKLELNRDEIFELKRYCDKRATVFLTTIFDEGSLEDLGALDLPAFKVASTDLTNLPFLEKIAKKGKPIFLSTGMSFLGEIELALRKINPLNRNVILLHCTSSYPAKNEEINLNIIETYKKRFNILVGYSDHSAGIGAAPFAVPMGARVIEKHFTISKKLPGPDHKASLTPEELSRLVKEIRKVEAYLGSGIKRPTPQEIHIRPLLQKSLVASRLIHQGEAFSGNNMVAKRTGGIGISPIYWDKVAGRIARKDFKKDEAIST